MQRKELASGQQEVDSNLSEDVIYRIDIPANRYDMLCIEGISRALNIFRGVQDVPKYTLSNIPGKLTPKVGLHSNPPEVACRRAAQIFIALY
jgi:phenylalanyl-tRNA synthetase beta chain